MTGINNVGEYLKKHDIKPSYQRIKIFEYLLNNRTHPTVDEIFKALIGNIPTLSKTTVYNTLKLFTDKNIVIVINIEDNETRYDADVSNHGHFKCIKCGKVYDFKIDLGNVELKELDNFDVHEYHFYIKGICDKCKST